jgi:hypothetical protein
MKNLAVVLEKRIYIKRTVNCLTHCSVDSFLEDSFWDTSEFPWMHVEFS